MEPASHTTRYLTAIADLARAVDPAQLDAMAAGLAARRDGGGRLFILGVGGGAGHASHAVNDFRKLCHFEAYAPSDNVSELTARTNDEGWETTYVEWLKTSRISERDAVLVFSVGGGSREHGISTNLVRAMDHAVEAGALVYGVIGRAEGHANQVADVCVVVEAPADLATPLVESFQAVLWHLLVSHPALAAQAGKWESTTAAR